MVAIAAIVLAAKSEQAACVGREFIPLENWAYSAIERFEVLGLCRLPDDRPFTRSEFVDIVTKLSKRAWDRRLSPRDRYQLKRLEKEFTAFGAARDPQTRYDPPTIYLPDAPLLLTGDVDLVGSVERPAFDDRIDPFLQSNPEFQIHYADRVTLDMRYRLIWSLQRGDRVRNAKPSRREKSFKGLTSLFERGYVIAAWDKVHLYYGREYVDWGPSDENNLITPGNALSLDQLGGRIRLGSLRLSFFDGPLSFSPERRFAGHRLEIAFWKASLGLNETVVYVGRGLDPVYAIPLSSFYANQFNERGDDNVMWSIDAKVAAGHGALLYASLLIDDAQFERDGLNPDKFAADVGGCFAISAPVAATIRARYRFVDIYTLTHRDSITAYVSGPGDPRVDVPLGAAPGPDTEQWHIEAETYPRANAIVRAFVSGLAVGAGNDFRKFLPGDPTNPPFPSGIVERTLSAGLGFRWEFDRNQWMDASWQWRRVTNADRLRGDNESTQTFRLEARFEFL